MRIYLINLARRPDRLATMREAAAKLDLELDRVEACDAASAAIPAGTFNDKGPLGEIPRGDKACFLSHRAAWEEFLAGPDSHAAILEDDVILTRSAARFLKDASWILPGVAVVKLELFGPPSQSVLVSDIRDLGDGFRLGRMRSRHTGGAAYIVSRKAAQRLVAETPITLPVDHLIFNPNNSPVFAALAPWQLLPAVARQQNFIGPKSDIEQTRVHLRKFNLTYVRRELIRFGYDLKLLPKQIFLLASGQAKFVRVGTED